MKICEGCLILFCQLAGGGLRYADLEFSVPSLVASAAKSKRAVFTNRKKIFSCSKFLRLFRTFVLGLIFRLGVLKSIWLSVFLASSSTLTPLSRAVNSILVRFQICLVPKLHISSDHVVFQWDLEELAGTKLDFWLLLS